MKMYSIETVKIALSSNDNKRIPMKEDPFMTYAIFPTFGRVTEKFNFSF